jgi:hypothetical protein
MIPEEAVDAATKVLVDSLAANELGWVDADDLSVVVIDVRDFDLAAAVTAILETVAPIMLANAFDEGSMATHAFEWSGDEQPLTNPYRAAANREHLEKFRDWKVGDGVE